MIDKSTDEDQLGPRADVLYLLTKKVGGALSTCCVYRHVKAEVCYSWNRWWEDQRQIYLEHLIHAQSLIDVIPIQGHVALDVWRIPVLSSLGEHNDGVSFISNVDPHRFVWTRVQESPIDRRRLVCTRWIPIDPHPNALYWSCVRDGFTCLKQR